MRNFAAMNVQKNVALALLRTKLNALSLISRKKAGEEAFRLFITPPKKARRNSPVFEASEKLSFQLNGRWVHGYRANHPQEKKVLLLHGFSSNCHHFDRYVEPLTAKGYEVLAFDAPAHGASEGKTVHAMMYAEMIREVVERYGPVNAFVGHSFGGLSVCLALEQLDHGPDTKIVLIAPATETTTAIDSAFNLIGLKNPRIREDMENIIFSMSGQKAEWFSVSRAIRHLKASVLWVHDQDDDVTPLSDAEKVRQANHQHVRFSITSGLGHHQVYRHPDVVKQVAEFL